MQATENKKVIVKKKLTLYDALQQMAQTATTQKGKFYFMPFWFQEHGSFDLRVLPFSELPEEIKEELLKYKNNANNGQQNHSEADAGSTGG
jgi:hypothetical protein